MRCVQVVQIPLEKYSLWGHKRGENSVSIVISIPKQVFQQPV